MVLIPLESRSKTLFIHVYKSKWPKIALSKVLTQPVLFVSTTIAGKHNPTCHAIKFLELEKHQECIFTIICLPELNQWCGLKISSQFSNH
jgi:hypothetical protein